MADARVRSRQRRSWRRYAIFVGFSIGLAGRAIWGRMNYVGPPVALGYMFPFPVPMPEGRAAAVYLTKRFIAVVVYYFFCEYFFGND